MGTGREYNEERKLKARNNAENIAKDENTKGSHVKQRL